MATNENMDTTAVAGNEDERKLFAGGFPQDTTEAQIKEHFGQFGEIQTVTLKTNMTTGRSTGFCSIVYESVDSLEAAVATEHTISNKKVFVQKTPVFALRHSGACNQCLLLWLVPAIVAGTFLYELCFK
jgi:RNA recognition motif-containing protein